MTDEERLNHLIRYHGFSLLQMCGSDWTAFRQSTDEEIGKEVRRLIDETIVRTKEMYERLAAEGHLNA